MLDILFFDFYRLVFCILIVIVILYNNEYSVCLKKKKFIKKILLKYDKRLFKMILGNVFVGSRIVVCFKILIKFRCKCKKKMM